MDGVEEEEELLDPRSSVVSRRTRVAATVLVGLAVVALVVARSRTHSSPRPVVAPTVLPVPSDAPADWPSAPGPCHGKSDLALVTSTPPGQRTDITVLVGGDELRTVDFDTGRVLSLSEPLRDEGYVTTFGPGYARAAGCSNTSVRIFRLAADGRMTEVAHGVDALFGPDGRAWRVTYPDDEYSAGTLAPIAGGRAVRLPAGFAAVAVVGGLAIGNGQPPQSGYGSAGPLLLVDAATGRVRTNLGPGAVVAANTQVLVWADDCRTDVLDCVVHRRLLSTGATADYALPRAPHSLEGVFSPDGRLLAFPLDRPEPDPRFTANNPFPPADIAMLHLDTGRLDIVPGLEIPAQAGAALAFSNDNRWLVICLDEGSNARILAWRPGLASPYETVQVPARSLGGAPLMIWPPS